MSIRLLIWVGLVLTLSGCAVYALAGAGAHRTDTYSFATPIDWSERSGQPVVWTVGGESLEFLLHFEGVRNNTKVFESMPDDLGQPFSADMRPSEVVDLFVESFGLAWGARAVKLLALRPSEFGPWRGFAFELEFESASGLAMRAVANGALIEDRLYLIVYAGALNYYFDKYLPYFEEMVESITPIG